LAILKPYFLLKKSYKISPFFHYLCYYNENNLSSSTSSSSYRESSMDKAKQAFLKVFGPLALLAIVGLVVFGPDNPNSREKIVSYLQKNGFTAIKVTDAVWCSNNNNGLRRSFSAINAQGQSVDGKVCADKIVTTPRVSI
jgi:hypothetical protein